MSYELRTIGDGHAESHTRYNATDVTTFPLGTVYAEITTRLSTGRVGSTFLSPRRFAILLGIARNPQSVGSDESGLKSNPNDIDSLLQFARIGTRILGDKIGIVKTDESKTAYHAALDALTPDETSVATVARIVGNSFGTVATPDTDATPDTVATPDAGETAKQRKNRRARERGAAKKQN